MRRLERFDEEIATIKQSQQEELERKEEEVKQVQEEKVLILQCILKTI